MEINFEGIGHKYRKIIRNTFEKALEVTDNNEERIVVTVAFAKKNRIKELNNLYRKVDRETDVLSFPMLDIVYPQSVKDFKEEYAPDGSLYLGDIVICPKIAKKQAKQYGHSKKREIGFLALHGFLHILGYDHIESEDEKVMMETSERVLNEMELKRD